MLGSRGDPPARKVGDLPRRSRFLIFLNLSAVLVNLIGSIVYALVFPYVALGRTLLYLDLCAREEAEEEAGVTRKRWYSRPRPATETG